ncbi:MAG: NAD-dependent epimerase/dehydratase family protein [Rhodobacteraceae bacterium]|nr:NAD-dependent epimerase/dehydratase family protein [Paracoccaceae bacterium]
MGKIMVTGAAGFIGRHCVVAALARGHSVVAVVRREAAFPAGVEVVVADLNDVQELPAVDAVIHAAASLAGDGTEMARDTIAATKGLIDALQGRVRIVLVSSIAVYDTLSLAVGDVLDETIAVEAKPEQRDGYCRAKLAQEALVMASGQDGFLIRVGAVYGKGRLWNGHLGLAMGPMLLGVGTRGEVPLCYVENCAQALVMATETPVNGVGYLNLVDDDLPDRGAYVQALQSGGWPRFVLPFSWRILQVMAALFGWLPGMPGLLRPAILHARMKPLRYANARLKRRFGWQSNVSFAEAMERSVNRGPHG